MTTAHRPTWNSAVASGTNPSGGLFVAQTSKVANRDAASFLSLKTRKVGQGLPEERGSRQEFREDLERREKRARDEKLGVSATAAAREEKRPRPAAIQDNPFPEDADDDAASGKERSDAEDDDDDEDTEELMRELQKIKKEREVAEEAVKEQQRKHDERSRRDEIMKGNPLLASGDFSLKRNWDDDTVFKNQAKTYTKAKARYINDAVRSDFHRKFLNKYVWVDGVAH